MADEFFGKKREPVDLQRMIDEESERGQSVSRARNRTVLLTPDVTSQVRSRLNEEEPSTEQDPVSDMLPPVRWDRPGTGASMVTPPAATEASKPFTPERFESVAIPPAEQDLRRATGKLASSSPLPPLSPQPAATGTATRQRAGTIQMTMESRPDSIQRTPAPAAPVTPAAPVAPSAPVAPAAQASSAVASSGGTRSDLKPWEQLLTDTPGPIAAAKPANASKSSAVNLSEAPKVNAAEKVEEKKMNATAQSMNVTPATQVAPRKASGKIVGFLIGVSAEGPSEVVELKTGRWLITSRPTDHGEYILLEDETVSPLHAILRVTKDNKVQLLDQLSEHGTGVTPSGKSEEEELTGAMVSIGHGDLIRFGQKYFVACVIPAVKLPEAK